MKNQTKRYPTLTQIGILVLLTQFDFAQQGTCGNGIVEDSEQCDDYDIISGDGCSKFCRIEEGFACYNNKDDYANCNVYCGNNPAQNCSDGNKDSGDGCSVGCLVEEGHFCEVSILSSKGRCYEFRPFFMETDQYDFTNYQKCLMFAELFDATQFTASPSFDQMTNETVTCNKISRCPNATTSNPQTCSWDRKLAVSCLEMPNGEAKIRVQTNSLPNHCFRKNIVGIAINGVPIYTGSSEYDNDAFFPASYGVNSVPPSLEIDTCLGSIGSSKYYHYYSFSNCIFPSSHSTLLTQSLCKNLQDCSSDPMAYSIQFQEDKVQGALPIGIAKDGHMIVGPYKADGLLWQPCDVDLCNGAVVDGNYVYVSTLFHPYTVGCWGPGATARKFKQQCTQQAKICSDQFSSISQATYNIAHSLLMIILTVSLINLYLI
eukprot:403347133